MAMTPAETLQVAQVQTTHFNPSKGAVEPKGVEPAAQGPDIHPEDEQPQVAWKETPVNLGPSGNVSIGKLKFAQDAVNETPVPVPPGTSTETPAEPPKPEEPKPQGEETPKVDAKRFAMLAREAKKIAIERRELLAMRQELDAKLAEVRRFNQLKAKAKVDPLGAVKEGFDLGYDDMTQAALRDDGKAAPETQLKGVREELSTLRKELAAKEHAAINSSVTRLKQQEQEVIGDFVQGIRNAVASNAQEYPYINFFGASDHVANLVFDNFKKTGQIVATEEALKFAEDKYRNYYAEKQPKQKSATPSATQAVPKQAANSGGARTLSNSMTVSSRATVNGSSSKKSDDQRLREAIAALQLSKA